MTTYQIIIKKNATVVKTRGEDWLPISEKDGVKEYGYTPKIEREVTEEREIYTQTVDDLDLAAVIIAVNKLKGKIS